MASNFPKLPGYVVTHDPTIVSHKKVSHVKLEQIRNGQNVEVPLYAVPKPAHADSFRPEKTEASKSYSQTTFINHTGGKTEEQFEPTFVKLDKQVSDLLMNALPYPSPHLLFSNLFYYIGAPFLWLLQGKCRGESSRKLPHPPLKRVLLP